MTSVSTWLTHHGYVVSPGGAAIYTRFLSLVLGAVYEAAVAVRAQPHWSEFIGRPGALRQVRIKRGISERLPYEEAITQALSEKLHDLLCGLSADHPLRDFGVSFSAEASPLARDRSGVPIGRSARRTDLRAQSYVQKLELVFESKLVDSAAEVRSRLLGKKGLGCFVEPELRYSEAPIGGLLAYTVIGTESEWEERVRTAYTRTPALATNCVRMDLGNGLDFLAAEVERSAIHPSPILMVNVALRFDAEPPRSRE